MTPIRRNTRRLAGLLGSLVLIGFWLTWPQAVAAQEPPPRPTLEPTATPVPTSKPSDETPPTPTPVPTGRIIGTVIDLSSGAPARGIKVRVGDSTVVTDRNGNYERSGLTAGAYVVALDLSTDQGTPAQDPLTIQLAAGATVVQHLAFRSQPAASPTSAPNVTPSATSIATPPAALPAPPPPTMPSTLPNTGALLTGGWIVATYFAIGLIAGGIGVRRALRGQSQRQ